MKIEIDLTKILSFLDLSVVRSLIVDLTIIALSISIAVFVLSVTLLGRAAKLTMEKSQKKKVIVKTSGLSLH
jgi:hypothetical protein